MTKNELHQGFVVNCFIIFHILYALNYLHNKNGRDLHLCTNETNSATCKLYVTKQSLGRIP